MALLCQKCGCSGYTENLVYCNRCKISAEHVYCLNDEDQDWSCEECKDKDKLPHALGLKETNQKKDISGALTNNKVLSLNDASLNRVSKKRRRLILPENDTFEDDDGPDSETNNIVQTTTSQITVGCFDIDGERSGNIVAHLSSKASMKVRESINRLPPIFYAEKQPRSHVWPRSFASRHPADHDIAIFLFPACESEALKFDILLHDIISYDLALKIPMDFAELLIFSSFELPRDCWQFQERSYMWGVFRRHAAVPREHLFPNINCTEFSPILIGEIDGKRMEDRIGPNNDCVKDSISISVETSLICNHTISISGHNPKKSSEKEESSPSDNHSEQNDEKHKDPCVSKEHTSNSILIDFPSGLLESPTSDEKLIGEDCFDTSGTSLKLFPLEGEDLGVLKCRHARKLDLSLGLGYFSCNSGDFCDR